MKLKKLWLPVLSLTVIGGCAKICDTILNVHGSGFFVDSTICNGIFIGSLVLILILGWILSFADRNKNWMTKPSKNTACGIFGLIAAITIIGSGVISILQIDSSSILTISLCVLSLLGGGVLLFESCISLTGQNVIKKAPVIALAVPLYLCARFINLYSQYTERSILATEMFDIVAVALLLLFFLYQSMLFAGLNYNTAIRKANVYGYAYMMCGFIVAVDLFIKMAYPTIASNVDTEIVEPTITNILTFAGDIALCGYAAFFLKSIQENAFEGEPSNGATPAQDNTPPTTDENPSDSDDRSAAVSDDVAQETEQALEDYSHPEHSGELEINRTTNSDMIDSSEIIAPAGPIKVKPVIATPIEEKN